MEMSWAPPHHWPSIARLPWQSAGFADAMRTLGYRPLYLWDTSDAALALIRGDIAGLRRLTARANVAVDTADARFIATILQALADQGIPHAKVGNTMWGVPDAALPVGWPFPRTAVIARHTFTLDLRKPAGALVADMQGAERKIRKAEREGVMVREVESKEELAAFSRLARETGDRVRARTSYTDFPGAFFEAVHGSLAASRTARFYIAWHKDVPIAAGLFFCTPDTMLYFLGGSTRDRDLTLKQGAAALFWHAILEARQQGLSAFDFGGCTPSADESDPRHGVYAFKKRWGGRLDTFCNLDVTFSPRAVRLQEGVLSPLWDRVHPLLLPLLQRTGRVS